MTRCNRIQAWLEEQPGARALPADLASHIAACEFCGDEWALHERLTQALRHLGPSDAEIRSLCATVERRLESEPRLPERAAPAPILLTGMPRRGLRLFLAAGALCLLFLALRAGWNGMPGRMLSREGEGEGEARRETLLSVSAFHGDVRLARNGGVRPLEAHEINIPVFAGDGVRLVGRSGIDFTATTGAMLHLAGNGTFVFRPGMLAVTAGQGTMRVRLAGEKFLVTFPQTILEIHGTTIEFRLTAHSEEIALVEGAAGYRLRNGRVTGRLLPGQILRVRDGLASISRAIGVVGVLGVLGEEGAASSAEVVQPMGAELSPEQFSPFPTLPGAGGGVGTQTMREAVGSRTAVAGGGRDTASEVGGPETATAPGIGAEPAIGTPPAIGSTIRRIDDDF